MLYNLFDYLNNECMGVAGERDDRWWLSLNCSLARCTTDRLLSHHENNAVSEPNSPPQNQTRTIRTFLLQIWIAFANHCREQPRPKVLYCPVECSFTIPMLSLLINVKFSTSSTQKHRKTSHSMSFALSPIKPRFISPQSEDSAEMTQSLNFYGTKLLSLVSFWTSRKPN
jgi:hypothetical protein